MLAHEAVAGFHDYGYSEDASVRLAIACFFAGCAIGAVLDYMLRFLGPKNRRHSPLLAVGKSWRTLRRLMSKSRQKVDAVTSAQDIMNAEYRDVPDQSPPHLSSSRLGPESGKEDIINLSFDIEEAAHVPARPEDNMYAEPPTLRSQVPDVLSTSATPTARPCHTTEKHLNHTAILVATSLTLHNVFEAVAMFVGTLYDPTFGVLVALSIILHNIPESVCVAFPVYYATGSRTKAVLWTVVPALGDLLGALVAFLAISGRPSDLLFGITFGLISGIMVYISVQELLPTAFKYDPGNRVVTPAALTGVAVMAISIMLSTL